MLLDRLLRRALDAGACDLHLKAGSHPTCRVHGRLEPLDDERRLEATAIDALVLGLLSDRQRQQFAELHQTDAAHSIEGLGRFRVSAFRQRGTK